MNKVLFLTLVTPLVFLAGCWGKKAEETTSTKQSKVATTSNEPAVEMENMEDAEAMAESEEK